MSSPFPLITDLGTTSFADAWTSMRAFTDARTPETADELWATEHPAVYTQGVAGKAEHLLSNALNIPVVKTDRGGQITFHGPGQVIVYCLIDLRRKPYGVRALVRRLEAGVIDFLALHGVAAHGREDAPGVYVGARKIASLGLKVRNGCTYHGVALNVDGDLAPFANINPCGLIGMQMTRCADVGIAESAPKVRVALAASISRALEVQ